MSNSVALYHRLISRILGWFPEVGKRWAASGVGEVATPLEERPWTPAPTDPFDAATMLVTTGGVHTPEQTPFDMSDARGDTSFRFIPRGQETFRITHDYYDHSDAETDINCLFPLPLARALSEAGVLGPLAERHLSFMGHIEEPLIPELTEDRLPELWTRMNERPDLILLSPA